MARSLNKVMLIGNVADEPVIRTYNGGSGKVANITVVTNEYRNSEAGQPPVEVPEWHRVVLWGRLSEIAENYVHKGTKVFIEGRLRTNSYVDKEGIKRYSTDIHADQLLLLSPNPNASQYQQGQNNYRAATNDGSYGGNYNQSNGNIGANNYNQPPYNAVNPQNGYTNNGMPQPNINPNQGMANGVNGNTFNQMPNNGIANMALPPYQSVNSSPIANDVGSFNQTAAMTNAGFVSSAPQAAMESINNFSNTPKMSAPMSPSMGQGMPDHSMASANNEPNQYAAMGNAVETANPSSSADEDDLPF